MFQSKHYYVLKTRDRENRKTVFIITTTLPVSAFVPIHLKGAELFCFALSSGVKTVDGPSFVHNLINQSIFWTRLSLVGREGSSSSWILQACRSSKKGQMLCWDAKARPTKIFYVISPSSSGTVSRPSTNRC